MAEIRFSPLKFTVLHTTSKSVPNNTLTFCFFPRSNLLFFGSSSVTTPLCEVVITHSIKTQYLQLHVSPMLKHSRALCYGTYDQIRDLNIPPQNNAYTCKYGQSELTSNHLGDDKLAVPHFNDVLVELIRGEVQLVLLFVGGLEVNEHVGAVDREQRAEYQRVVIVDVDVTTSLDRHCG